MLETHQRIACLFAAAGLLWVLVRDGWTPLAAARSILIIATLAPILLYRLIAEWAPFGFMESLASDFRGPHHAGPYALAFWLLFLIVLAFQVLDGSLY